MMLKVSELMMLLEETDPEAVVIMSSDSEGNKHSPLRHITIDLVYDAVYRHSGEVYDVSDGFEGVPCIAFYPAR